MRKRDPQKLLQQYLRLKAFALVFGFILFMVGGSYSIWSVKILRQPTQVQEQAFDTPIARLSQIFIRYQQRIKDHVGPQPTERELWLYQEVTRSNAINMNLFLFLMRVVPGMMLTTVGLLIFTVGLAAYDLDYILKSFKSNP